MEIQGLLNFVLIGAKHTGKSVYLSALLRHESVSALDTFTKEYLVETGAKLASGELLKATSGQLIPLRFSYKKENYYVEFSIEDFDGHFIETLSQDIETTQKERDTIRKNIKEAEGLLFVFPFEEGYMIDGQEESINRFQAEIDTFIQLVREIYPDHKDLPIPVVIAISKWDRSPNYRHTDEDEKAIEFIERNSQFLASKRQIETYFSNVVVMPISAYGETEDGFKPIKGKFNPYNVTRPIDYFLERTFYAFEEKAKKLVEEGDHFKLFDFLCAVYYDSRFYKIGSDGKGELIKLYEETESICANELLKNLKGASPKHQAAIIDINKHFIDNVRNKDTKQKINETLSQTQLLYRNKTITRASIVLSSLVIFSYAGLLYVNTRNEGDSWKLAMQMEHASPLERIIVAHDYLKNYEADNPVLYPFSDISQHRLEIESVISTSKNEAFSELNNRFENLRGEIGTSYTEENLLLFKEVGSDAKLLIKYGLGDKIVTYVDNFEDQVDERDRITLLLQRANTSLNSDDPDLIKELLDELNEIRPSMNIEVNSTKNNLQKRYIELTSYQEFNDLYSEVKELDADSISQIIQEKWKDIFGDKAKNNLALLVQSKIEEVEESSLKDLLSSFQDYNEVDSQEYEISRIKEKNYSIEVIGYRY